MLDAELLREPAVKHHLNQALDMMNRAVAGTFQPGARENMAYLISTERRYVGQGSNIFLVSCLASSLEHTDTEGAGNKTTNLLISCLASSFEYKGDWAQDY